MNATGQDAYGNIYSIASYDSDRFKLVSVGKVLPDTISIMFRKEYGDVANCIDKLTDFGFSIDYSPTATYTDRDVFVNFCKAQGLKVTFLASGEVIITDMDNKYYVPQLEGWVLNFS